MIQAEGIALFLLGSLKGMRGSGGGSRASGPLLSVTSILAASALMLLAGTTAASEAEAILRTFQLHPDFQIELVAMEPLVFDPVDLEFDEYGRAFVIEMPGYPFPDEPGRLVLLEDSDNDGIFDVRSVYAEGFPVADSILPYRGGMLVASPPDLIFVRDTDGDKRADVQEVLMSGFAAANTQHNFSGLNHGLDNWIYAVNGGNGGEVYWAERPENTTTVGRNDFRLDIPRQRFELYGRSTGGFEATFDDWGRFFTTHNLRPLSQMVFPGRYVANLPLPGIDHVKSLPDYEENGLVRIFAIGTQETRVNHPEQSGYFSGACGITYYGGGAFPAEFEGNLFVCDVVLNLVHRAVLSEEGAADTASRARERVEFLASTDRGFRPVNITIGPDGAMYVLDMHRTVIEHPEWIPDEIEAGLDLYEGNTRGRIYRITPKGGLPWVTPRFAREDVPGVVALLAHSNKWWRDTAQRLLVEWEDDAAVEPLRALLQDSADARARLHALWTLEGLDALDAQTLLGALEDTHPAVREHAVLITEARLEDPLLLRAVVALSDDPAPRVRMQVALSLGTQTEHSAPALEESLARIARHGLDDPWIRTALLSAGKDRPLPLFVTALRASADAEGFGEYVNALGVLIGREGDLGQLEIALAALEAGTAESTALLARGLEGLADGLGSARTRPQGASDKVAQVVADLLELSSADVQSAAWRIGRELQLDLTPTQRRILQEASALALDGSAPTAQRVDALTLLVFAPFAEREDQLFHLLGMEHPAEVRRAAMAQLSRAGGNRAVAERLVRLWKSLSPAEMRTASDVLLYQQGNHDLLLSALENGDIALGQMNFHLERRRRLLRSEDEAIRARAEALFSDAGVVTRHAAIEAMRPALTLEGDPLQGREAFMELCAQCHQIGDDGYTLAPNLTDSFRKSPEQLLFDILDPNAAVDSEFVGFVVETADGEFYSGILAAESDETVTLRQANDIETVFYRDQIRRMYSSGMSLMPEAMEADMPLQKMADLLAFLQEPR